MMSYSISEGTEQTIMEHPTQLYRLDQTFIKALLAILSGNFNEALDHLRVYELSSPEPRSHIHFYRGLALYRNGNPDAAKTSMQAYLQQEPADEFAHFYLGNIYFDKQDYAAALTAYTRALELREDFPEALINAGILARRLGDQQTAKALATNDAVFCGIFEEGVLKKDLMAIALSNHVMKDASDAVVFVEKFTHLSPLLETAAWLNRATSGAISHLPLVSVVIPAYNAQDNLEKALDSIVNQTYTNWELLAIDDGSTDNTAAILDMYAARDQRIRIIGHDRNRGVSAARNTGFQAATGTYIAFMDADDISLPERLEKQVAFLEGHPEVDVCGTLANTLGESQNKTIHRPVTDKEIKLNMLIVCAVISASTMMRTKSLRDHDLLFDESLTVVEDYDFWCRAAEHLIYHNIPEVLYLYRRVETSLSYSYSEKMAAATHEVIAKNLNRLLDCPLAFPALHKPNCTDEELTATINDLNQVISHLKQPCFFSPGELQVVIDYLIKQCQDVLSRRQEKRQIRT